MLTQTLKRGHALACLLLLLTACASNPIIETRTVEVAVPIHVPLPAELLAPVAAQDLPAGEITNEDLADLIERLRATVDALNHRLRLIRDRQPAD